MIERLDAVLAFRLTLLLAPAGYGKSTLLRRWATARRGQVAWVALTAADNEPARFLADIATAVAVIVPESALQTPRSLTRNAPVVLVDGIVDLINALAAVSDDFVLVLDDYHLIEAPEVHEAIVLMLDYPPPTLHLVIAARSEPPLPLARLRVRRQLLAVGPNDLGASA